MSDHTVHPLIGVPLLAVGYPLWCHSGERFAFEPGDVFELDEADVALGLVDPDFWLRAGVARIATEAEVTAAHLQLAGETEPPPPVSRETKRTKATDDKGADA